MRARFSPAVEPRHFRFVERRACNIPVIERQNTFVNVADSTRYLQHRLAYSRSTRPRSPGRAIDSAESPTLLCKWNASEIQYVFRGKSLHIGNRVIDTSRTHMYVHTTFLERRRERLVNFEKGTPRCVFDTGRCSSGSGIRRGSGHGKFSNESHLAGTCREKPVSLVSRGIEKRRGR